MKKQIVVLGIVIILLAVGLCGCNETNNDKNDNNEQGSLDNRLFGTWGNGTRDIGTWPNGTVRVMPSVYEWYKFSSNGSWNLSLLSGWNIEWTVIDNQLILYQGEYKFMFDPIRYYYSFNDDFTQLILTDVDEPRWTYRYTKE